MFTNFSLTHSHTHTRIHVYSTYTHIYTHIHTGKSCSTPRNTRAWSTCSPQNTSSRLSPWSSLGLQSGGGSGHSTHTHTHTHTHPHTHACIHTHAYIHTYVFCAKLSLARRIVCVCVYLYMCMYMYVYEYVCRCGCGCGCGCGCAGGRYLALRSQSPRCAHCLFTAALPYMRTKASCPLPVRAIQTRIVVGGVGSCTRSIGPVQPL
jgi:hypothetical protein